MRVKTITVGIAVATGLVLGAFGGAAVAWSDVDQYLDDMHINSNIVGSDNQLIEFGNAACRGRDQQVQMDITVAQISAGQISKQDAQYLYNSALQNLCPR